MSESRFRELERWARVRIQAMIDLSRVPVGGTVGQVVTKTVTGYGWETNASGAGNVVGPASATNNAVALFNSTTGALLKNSAILVSGTAITGASSITSTAFVGAAPAGTLSGATLASNVLASSLTSVGTLAGLTVTATITGSVSGSSGSTTGNAATATALATARAINGVNFDGTAAITVTAAAGTLSGNTLASGVTASSLTSVGTLSAGAVPASLVTGVLPNANTTATSSNTVGAIVARNAGGNFAATTITADLTGNVTGNLTGNVTGGLVGNADSATILQTSRNFSASGDATAPSVGFTGAANVALVMTLANTAVTAATYGGSTAIPEITIDAKGRITGATTRAVIAPAGTLTGATLASGVTASSLTSHGTLVSGAVPASLVTAGTFGAGAYTFPSTLAIAGALTGVTTATIINPAATSTITGANKLLTIKSNASNADATMVFSDNVTNDGWISWKGSNFIIAPSAGSPAVLLMNTAQSTFSGPLAITGALTGVTTLATSARITSTFPTGAADLLLTATTATNYAALILQSNGSAAYVGKEGTTTNFGGATDDFVIYNNVLALRIARTTGAATFASTLAVTGATTLSSGVTVTGSPTGYTDELKFGNTGAGAQVAISSASTGSPTMLFDHRATSNTGLWTWRNGTGAGTTRMTLSAAGALTATDFVLA